MTKYNQLVIVDELTGLKCSSFYCTKNGIVEPMRIQLQEQKMIEKAIKCMGCSNAGENTLVEKCANGPSRI